MVPVSLKLALVGFALVCLFGQSDVPANASLTRPPLDPRRTVDRRTDCSSRVSAFEGRAANAGHACRRSVRRQMRRATDPSSESSIFDTIDDCSPFSSVDGARQLDFDVIGGLVTLSDEAGGLLAPASGDTPLKSVGTFVADEKTQQVFIRVAGLKGRYTLVAPAGSDQCILAAGDTDAADLERSWYGAAEEDDPTLPSDDDDGSPSPI
jgi:hypothetical protein